MRRIGTTLLAGTALAVVIAVPASAKPDLTDTNRITICHVTNSSNHAYHAITVDPSAFDGEGQNDHTTHVNKDGLADKAYDPSFGCDAVAPTTTSTTTTTLPPG